MLYYHSENKSDNMLTPRKEEILAYIVETYIRDAEPIGSKLMSEDSNLGVSGATLRNEMRELEEAGLLTHPHTSSGRIPTEAGYRYYVEHLMRPEVIGKRVFDKIDTILKQHSERERKLKMFARVTSEMCGTAVIVLSKKDSLYYTGISQFFSQPEFKDYSFTVSMSGIFDACEEVIPTLYKEYTSTKPKIMIGSENPFGSMCSMVGKKMDSGAFIAILGPLRMRYNRAFTLLEYTNQLF